jgi:hypothetical protein
MRNAPSPSSVNDRAPDDSRGLSVDAIAAVARERGLSVIRVADLAKQPPALRFEGTLDEFWEATAGLGTQAVLLMTSEFDPDCFAEPDIAEEDRAASLLDYAPELERFRNRVGQIDTVWLVALSPLCRLETYVAAQWLAEYEALLATAEAQREAAIAQVEDADEEARESAYERLLARVRAFADDEDCLALKTQGQIRLYVLEHAPELLELASADLKDEIVRLQLRAQQRRGSARRAG